MFGLIRRQLIFASRILAGAALLSQLFVHDRRPLPNGRQADVSVRFRLSR